ncbi:MAG: NAD(P)-dependent oxidoreductase [Alphaproteobacteria bacterium]|nr:NAD(P)-dependent oxidoreductase [Alphaproteobacteria bacterium]
MSTPLAGKTLFITGASRGIGKAIALRAARDGANVALAAKTAEPHPKLDGTIYTAAEEIEAAGGTALPLIVDVRDADRVRDAVAETVDRFGGLDVLVNNASAISLSGTLDTDLKRFDLMHQINARGAFVCGQACLPHLIASDNPHILSISPPLDFADHWWGTNFGWTLAKYGMSLCVRAWAEEFRDHGVAANALWPRSTISTAAIAMLGGQEALSHCRTPDIMGDAAHAILSQPSRECTGRYFIDDEALTMAGVTDFDRYAVARGTVLYRDLLVDSDGGFEMAAMPPRGNG